MLFVLIFDCGLFEFVYFVCYCDLRVVGGVLHILLAVFVIRGGGCLIV